MAPVRWLFFCDKKVRFYVLLKVVFFHEKCIEKQRDRKAGIEKNEAPAIWVFLLRVRICGGNEDAKSLLCCLLFKTGFKILPGQSTIVAKKGHFYME